MIDDCGLKGARRRFRTKGVQSTIKNQQPTITLFLALRTIVAAASRNHDSLDGSLADETRFRFAPVNPMLKLEQSFFAIGIYIIRDGRTAERNRFSQYFFHSDEELFQSLTRDARGAPARANAGPEQGLIGINVAHSAQQFLIEQRALDGSLPAAKQPQKAIEFDFQGLDAGCIEVSRCGHAESPKTPGIDEPQFPA